MLDDLDKELERRGLSFCRYADDCNIYILKPARQSIVRLKEKVKAIYRGGRGRNIRKTIAELTVVLRRTRQVDKTETARHLMAAEPWFLFRK
jgi:retron-type reverse transcriptase